MKALNAIFPIGNPTFLPLITGLESLKKRIHSFSAKQSKLNTTAKSSAEIIIRDVTFPICLIYKTAVVSPAKSNEQESIGTSPLNPSTNNIIHAKLDAMEDDTLQESHSRVA